MTQFSLPSNVVSRADVSRLAIELERVDNDLTAAAVRAKQGVSAEDQRPMSALLSAFIELTSVSLEDGHKRSELIKELRALKETVPVIHMTFASVAEPESLQLLVNWLRTEIHPQAVLEVGLQPSLVAGVYLRTPNKVHDLSLRAVLESQRDLLVQDLESYRGK